MYISNFRKTAGLFAAAVFFVSATVTLPAQKAAAGKKLPPLGPVNRVPPEPRNWEEHAGWTSLFDGKTLTGWSGAPEVWSVADGAIVGSSSEAVPSGTTNLIYKVSQFANFRLRMEVKMEGTGANGGVQYRSHIVPVRDRIPPANPTEEQKARMAKTAELNKKHAAWNMTGYQMDFNDDNRYTGQLYEQSSERGIMTYPGQVVAFEGRGAKPRVVAELGTGEQLKSYLKKDDWNEIEIIADGHTLTHIVNGHVFTQTIDTDPERMAAAGYIALEIEGPGTLRILHRNIYIKKLP
ncbi:DUF1080 domain-containing protein [Terriglobus sp. 2YAB30_2]|uniref:3-keto-disaccharide hydrolase n=1 Tax=unclassified Terriglobus TaxID=2628988 RepID=UPI003F9D0562